MGGPLPADAAIRPKLALAPFLTASPGLIENAAELDEVRGALHTSYRFGCESADDALRTRGIGAFAKTLGDLSQLPLSPISSAPTRVLASAVYQAFTIPGAWLAYLWETTSFSGGLPLGAVRFVNIHTQRFFP